MFDFSAQMKAFKMFSDLAMRSARESTQALADTVDATTEAAKPAAAASRPRTMAASRSSDARKQSKAIAPKAAPAKAAAKKTAATTAAAKKAAAGKKTTAAKPAVRAAATRKAATRTTASKPAAARSSAKSKAPTRIAAKASTKAATASKAKPAAKVTAKPKKAAAAARSTHSLSGKSAPTGAARQHSGPPMEPFAIARPEQAEAIFADFSRSLMSFWNPQLAANVGLNGDAGADIEEGIETAAHKVQAPAEKNRQTTAMTEAASSMMEVANPFFWFDAMADAMKPAEIAPKPEPEPEAANPFDPAIYFDLKTWAPWLDSEQTNARKLPATASRAPKAIQDSTRFSHDDAIDLPAIDLPDVMQKMLDPFGLMQGWTDAAAKFTSAPKASAYLPQPAAGGFPGFGTMPGFGAPSEHQNPFLAMFQNPFMPASAAPICAPFAAGSSSPSSMFGAPSGVPGMMMVTVAMPFDPMAIAKKMMGMH